MKTTHFLIFLFCANMLFAQNKPTSAISPLGFYSLRNDFPGLKRDFTQMKIRVLGEYPYNYSVNVKSSGGIITSTAFANESSDWLFKSYRSTATKSGNTYIANIEVKEDGEWMDSGRETAYFDESGNDTLWVIGSPGYRRKTVKRYDAAGNFIWSGSYFEANEDWVIEDERSIRYENNRRITDTIYYYPFAASRKPVTLIEYAYVSGKLDSIAVSYIIDEFYPGFSHGFKLKKSTDGGILQIKTYTDDLEQGAIVVSEYADFTGGTSGVKEINSDLATIYPIPANNALNINLKTAGEYEMQILDLNGKCILTENISAHKTINISDLDAGLYFILLQNEQQISRQLISVCR